MKIKLTILFVFLTIQVITSQNYQTVEDVNDACSQLGFAGDEDAEIAVDRILDQIGLFRNFTIQECPDINNAVAKIIESDGGVKERYILYDNNFFSKIDNKADSDWAAISILAHEIGHHLNGHALNNEGSSHKFELEADYFSGISLAKMGASLAEAQSAIQTLRYEKATSTHPAKADRLKEIERGWNKAKGITTTKSTEEENKEKAFSLFRKGEIAFQEYNYSDAIEYFNQAKDLGNVDAYYYLSNCYYLGFGVLIDYDEAYKLAETGYNLGSIPSTYQMGKYLSNGTGIVTNKEDAERLFQKDFQVKWFKDQYKKNKIPFHAYTIGYMYGNGYGGVNKDDENAIIWYKQAALLGDLVGQSNLGVQYEYGKGVEQNYSEAASWYRKAAEMDYANAQYNLGIRYNNGEGVGGVDYTKAFYWLSRSADQGSPISQYEIGVMYYYGKGVEKDFDKAQDWFAKANKQGYAEASYFLAFMYYSNEAKLKEEDEWKRNIGAISLFKKAGKRGHRHAQFMTGKMYSEGKGLKQNYEEALFWFRKAAEQGSPDAQFNIGVMYYNGEGVKKDDTLAMEWWIKAGKQKHQRARELLNDFWGYTFIE